MPFYNENAENEVNAAKGMLGKYVESPLLEDETSRDSGIADMDTDAPTDFALLDDFELQPLDMEMNELAILDCKENRDFTIIGSRQRSFTEVTNTTPLSTFESPKSRTSLFKAPSMPHSKSFAPRVRKRSLADSRMNFKRFKNQMSIDEDLEIKENKASCSIPSAAPSVFFNKRPMLHRAFSTSDVDAARPDSPVRNYHLPTLAKDDSVAFGRIEASTLISIMKSEGHASFMEKYILVDCRYPYEYQGGHIKGAINLFDPELCGSIFYSAEGRTETRTPIFYCEFSQKRGPFMAYSLRQVDRQRNIESYPNLDYSEIYVVDGGYKGFFEAFQNSEHQDMCSPACSYTTMIDKRFTQDLKKYPFHKCGGGGATTMAKKPSSRRHLAIRHQNSLRNFDSSPTARSPTSRNLFGVPKDSSSPVKGTPITMRPLSAKLIFS